MHALKSSATADMVVRQDKVVWQPSGESTVTARLRIDAVSEIC